METVHSKDGTTIAFDRVGSGDPVILVGGALTQRTSPQVEGLVPPLAERFTVLNYDRRGRGDSGDTLPYAVAREAEDLAALIAAAGGSAFVFGSSSGAALALEAAAGGLAITKLALWEPPLDVQDSNRSEPSGLAERIAALVASGRRSEAVEAFFVEGIGLPSEEVAPMRGMPWWLALEAMAQTIAYDLAIVGDGALLRERAPSVTIPTLVMEGGASDAGMRDAARALAAAMPNAQLLTLEGQDHAADPAVVAAAMAAFFAGERIASPAGSGGRTRD